MNPTESAPATLVIKGQPFPFWPTVGTLLLAILAGVGAVILATILYLVLVGNLRPDDQAAQVLIIAFDLSATFVIARRWGRLSGYADIGFHRLRAHDWGIITGGLIFIRIFLGVALVVYLLALGQSKHVQPGLEHLAFTDPLSDALIILGGVVIAPFCEEIVFRAFLLRAMATWMPSFWAILGSSALFALAHGDLVLFPYLLAFGATMAVVYRTTRKLWVPIILHALNNLVALSLIALHVGHA